MKPAILFDLDGTLVDTAPDIHLTANAVLAAESLPSLSFETVRGFIGNGVGVLISHLLTTHNLPSSGPQHQRMVANFARIIEQAIVLTKPYPGVTDALQTLHDQGYRLGICTNKPLGPTRAVLSHFDLLPYFPVIVGGDSLPQRKPDPAPLRHAAELIGGGAALFVGDSEVDAETAHATPLPFVLFTEGYRKAACADLNPKASFASFANLPGVISKLY